MSAPNDGGPAFPLHAGTPVDTVAELMGMSLRDYFAGKALSGFLADPRSVVEHSPFEIKAAAAIAYTYADAMLVARSTGRPE